MKYLVFPLLFALSGFAQHGFRKPAALPPPLILSPVAQNGLHISLDPKDFQDLNRASRAYNRYFSVPRDLVLKRFADGRFATQVDVFEYVNNAIESRRYPEMKW
jgi:hypothetical protein